MLCDDASLPVYPRRSLGHALPLDGRFTVLPSGRTLTVTDVRPEDEGLYVCVAQNEAGERSASAELLIKPRGQGNS